MASGDPFQVADPALDSRICIFEMIRAGQWCQVKLSRQHIYVNPALRGVDSGRGQDRTLRGMAPVERAIDGWS